MERADIWLRLRRMQEPVERAEGRVVLVREAAHACRDRMAQWRELANVRRLFRERARDRHMWRLASHWHALADEAERAADLEAEQAASLDHQLDVLDLTARCAKSDCDDLEDEVVSSFR